MVLLVKERNLRSFAEKAKKKGGKSSASEEGWKKKLKKKGKKKIIITFVLFRMKRQKKNRGEEDRDLRIALLFFCIFPFSVTESNHFRFLNHRP